jgi:hypothetical protein
MRVILTKMSLHFSTKVSQERAEKVARVVVSRGAARDFVGARLHYTADSFGAEQISSFRPLLQQMIRNVVRGPEQLQKAFLTFGFVVVMGFRRVEGE